MCDWQHIFKHVGRLDEYSTRTNCLWSKCKPYIFSVHVVLPKHTCTYKISSKLFTRIKEKSRKSSWYQCTRRTAEHRPEIIHNKWMKLPISLEQCPNRQHHNVVVYDSPIFLRSIVKENGSVNFTDNGWKKIMILNIRCKFFYFSLCWNVVLPSHIHSPLTQDLLHKSLSYLYMMLN